MNQTLIDRMPDTRIQPSWQYQRSKNVAYKSSRGRICLYSMLRQGTCCTSYSIRFNLGSILGTAGTQLAPSLWARINCSPPDTYRLGRIQLALPTEFPICVCLLRPGGNLSSDAHQLIHLPPSSCCCQKCLWWYFYDAPTAISYPLANARKIIWHCRQHNNHPLAPPDLEQLDDLLHAICSKQQVVKPSPFSCFGWTSEGSTAVPVIFLLHLG